LPVAGHEYGGVVLVGKVFEKVAHPGAVDVIESLRGLIEYQQHRLLHQRAGDQGQSLFAVRELLGGVVRTETGVWSRGVPR